MFLTLQGEDPPGFLATFGSPIIALWSVILLSVDDLEARTTLDESQLLYPFLSYTLFIIFIIAMPLLFNNFLVKLINLLLHHYHSVFKYRLV